MTERSRPPQSEQSVGRTLSLHSLLSLDQSEQSVQSEQSERTPRARPPLQPRRVPPALAALGCRSAGTAARTRLHGGLSRKSRNSTPLGAVRLRIRDPRARSLTCAFMPCGRSVVAASGAGVAAVAARPRRITASCSQAVGLRSVAFSCARAGLAQSAPHHLADPLVGRVEAKVGDDVADDLGDVRAYPSRLVEPPVEAGFAGSAGLALLLHAEDGSHRMGAA